MQRCALSDADMQLLGGDGCHATLDIITGSNESRSHEAAIVYCGCRHILRAIVMFLESALPKQKVPIAGDPMGSTPQYKFSKQLWRGRAGMTYKDACSR